MYTINTDKLSEEQVKHFHQNGWVGPLDIFSPEEVELVRKDLEEISQIEFLGDQQVRTFNNHHLGTKSSMYMHFGIESLSRLFQDERIIRRLNQLGEEDLLFWRTGLWHRMPGQDGAGWHQTFNNFAYGALNDEHAELVFPDDETPLNLSVWVALADIPQETGTLQFANGTHRNEKFATTSVLPGQNAFAQGVMVSNPEKYDNVVTPGEEFAEADWDISEIPGVKAGQIIIFTETVMHKSPSNNSNQERWACNARYIKPNVLIHPQRNIDGYAYEYGGWDLKNHYSILVSGQDKYGINEVRDK